MAAICDEAFLRQRARKVQEEAQAAQSDSDWDSAALMLQRAMSDASAGFLNCPLPACRRAQRCLGNTPICMPRCKVELVPGGERECLEEFYAEIQEERRDAEAEGRAPDVERLMKDRVHVEFEEIDEDPAEDQIEDSLRLARQAPRHEKPSQPPAIPQSAVAPPSVATVAPPSEAPAAPLAARPPVPWQPNTSPEVQQRINQIWADYVAGKPMPRPEPRIRAL